MYLGDQSSRPRTLLDILESTAARHPNAAAIDDGNRVLTYRDLLAEIRDLGVRLRGSGIGLGDRVGVRMPSGSAELYVAILAVLAVGAAYVPVDADDPDERAETVWAQADVSMVIAGDGGLEDRGGSPGGQPGRPGPRDDAWIIFTSGSTGVPKGVAVTHRSAAAFVDAEARLFARSRPLGPGDRVLAGLSVAFDASCEEMWLAWRHGACLVPAARSLVKGGAEFGDWIVAHGITVVSTVPTLAALWTREQLRGVRLLILGGEACPAELATRLASMCPEVWNTYGPTEATVVASAGRLTVTGPVRIGLPLAGWDLAVADPQGRLVEWGDTGELVISGVGTARYLDRTKDAEKFVSLPGLGWPRVYRTGDLVRADPEGLSYLGRTDTQVKIRGYRVELSEIESVMLRIPGIAQAVVNVHQAQLGSNELAGYYSCELGRCVDPRQVHRQLRALLPAHMVPAYLQELASIPTMTSGKADRTALPLPARRVAAQASADVGSAMPANATETTLAEMLAGVLDLENVSVEAHFFDDLAANSVLMAHFCGQVRRNGQMPPVSMRDIYLHPTVRSLARVLSERSAAPAPHLTHPRSEQPRAGQAQYVLCGAVQAGVLLALTWLGALMVDEGARWIGGGRSGVELYLRVAEAVGAGFTILCILPILAKWVLVGRWKEQQIQIWSLRYCRFWVVKTLVRANPLTMFAGSPLFVLYLRALGAKIGRGAVVFPRSVPVCTDLLTIGAGTVIRRGCSLAGYRAERGMIHTGRTTIGDDVVVGDSTYVDINTSIGDGGQLGHSSSLHAGQSIPPGEVWCGSPAAAGPGDYRLEGTRCGGLRRAVFATVQSLGLLLGLPLVITAALSATPRFPWLEELVYVGPSGPGWGEMLLDQLVGSSALFWGGGALALLFVVTVPKILNLALTPGRVYPLYGFAYGFYRALSRITSTPFFINLYGDSSYIVGYLRALGYKASQAGQTGSNFGAQVAHDTPYLVSIGAGTMVSDGVRFLTADYSSSSFRISRVSIGNRCFLGNVISVPSDTRLGDNCFVGTKTMIPVDGDVRQDVGLLGSPPFEIPRTRPDQQFDLTRTELKNRLRAKDRYNLVTICVFLLVQWVRLYASLIIQCLAVRFHYELGFSAIALAALSIGTFSLFYSILVERVATSFRDLTPRYCSIYERYFWWHERFWKLSTQPAVLNGTAFKGAVWALLGVRTGRRVFDDGCSISEKTLVSIGADATIGAGTVLQAHSMEDGIFKSDHIVLGRRCTLGPGAFVHYGVTIGDRALLATDSFLMKGEAVAPSCSWLGNPAREDR
ncbi:MAG TPA: Pls/PosA family non-ribosomal peptide synthetase [Pseudonocardia sp.]|nr:Pls/PosA family non-ribosomal peptide synthetase [Pseudonocardia sp.]